MSCTARGSRMVCAIALALFAVSDQITNADEEKPKVEIEIKGGFKEKTRAKEKAKPIEIEKGDSDFEVGCTITLTGDCGTCFTAGQMILMRGKEIVDWYPIPAKETETGPSSHSLGKSGLLEKAQVGDIILITVTVTGVKDGKAVADGDSVTLRIIEAKKEEE